METQNENAKVVLTINSNTIAVTSLAVTLVGVLWNVFFGYATLIGRMDVMQNDIDDIKKTIVRIENRMDKFEGKRVCKINCVSNNC
jgi:hypothetical protein